MAERAPLHLVRERVEWRSFGDEVVLLDLRTSTYLSTNPAATTLWRLLEAGTSRDQLVDALAGSYELDRDVAARDVDAFLDDCRRRELLDEAGGE